MMPSANVMALYIHDKDHKKFEEISIRMGKILNDKTLVMTIPGCKRCEEFAKEVSDGRRN